MESSELSVVKSNEIIQARYNLTVQEQKFLLYLVSVIDRKQEEQKDIEIFDKCIIKVTEVEKLLNVSGKKWGSIYKIVKSIVISLNKKPLEIITPDGNPKIINWTDSIELVKGKGIIIYQFSHSIYPYILKLKEHFTKYNLSNILYLQSSYSIRLYELLKSNQYRGKVEYELLELKKMFFGSEYLNKYPVYYDFKKRVILRAEKELKERSDIYFTFKEKRKLRKVHSITFFIFKNEKNSAKAKGKSKELKIDDEKIEVLTNCLKRNGILEKKALVIAQKEFLIIKSDKSRAEAQKRNPSFLAYIEEKVSLLVFEQKKGKVKNPQGYLIKALEEDYVNFEYLNQIKRKEQQQKARERTALKNEKEKALQKLKTKSYNLNLKNLKIILGSIKPTVFFEAVEDANIGTMFKVELDKSKSPLENYEIQSASGRIPILNKMIANYKSDFETAEKKALDKKIKEVEKALRQI